MNGQIIFVGELGCETNQVTLMSVVRNGLSYASRLTPKTEKGGGMGGPEYRDAPEVIAKKTIHLAELFKSSKNCVILTGAGISTSAGIADFRGPNGVWTAEKKGKNPPKCGSFELANPTLTHMALVGLINAGHVNLVISQNVDGLHMRSGIPRDKMAELHGNLFLETCEDCGAEYLRDFDVGGISFKTTGRFCTKQDCKGALRDTLLDWDDPLPEPELQKAQDAINACDLCICLGTSLRIRPASELPVMAARRGAKLVICNLQNTPKDKHAYMNIHSPVDDVMSGLLALLAVPIPRFLREVHLVVTIRPRDDGDDAPHSISVRSSVGEFCPVPYIEDCGLHAVLDGPPGGPHGTGFLSEDDDEDEEDEKPLSQLIGPPWRKELPPGARRLRLTVRWAGERGPREMATVDLEPPPAEGGGSSRHGRAVPLSLRVREVDFEGSRDAARLVQDLQAQAEAASEASRLWGPDRLGPPALRAKRRLSAGVGEADEGGRPARRAPAFADAIAIGERDGWIQCQNKSCMRWSRRPPEGSSKLAASASAGEEAKPEPVFYCRRRCAEEARELAEP